MQKVKVKGTVISKRVKKGWFRDTFWVGFELPELNPTTMELPVGYPKYAQTDIGEKVEVSFWQKANGKLSPVMREI